MLRQYLVQMQERLNPGLIKGVSKTLIVNFRYVKLYNITEFLYVMSKFVLGIEEAEVVTAEVKKKVMSGVITVKKANEKQTFKRSKKRVFLLFLYSSSANFYLGFGIETKCGGFT